MTLFLVFASCFFCLQNGTSPIEARGGQHAAADSVLSEREYYSRLQAADEETFKRDFENYFLLLLDSEQKKTYEGLQSLDEKKAYIQYYWKASNPNPLFPENDWLLEFNRRVQYAKKHYESRSSPYVDDRGRYYIKYGEPKGQFVDKGGVVHYDINFLLVYETFPNETWSYENIQPNFVVYFVQDGFSYRQVRSLIEAVVDRGFMNQNMEYLTWGDMIEKRQHISPALARAVLPTPILRYGSRQAALIDRAEELILHNEVARNKAPSVARDALQAENKLKFFDQVTQFRGPGDKTRIDVALLVPLKKNIVKKVKKSLEDTLSVEFSGMLRDENFEPVIKDQSALSLPVKLAAGEKLPNAVGRFSLVAKPQSAELALQVQEKQGEKTGYNRRPFQIRDFSSRTALMLSDIQLNYRIRNDVQRKVLPTVPHPDFLMSPYPFHEIHKTKPPLVYFEIYNIRSAGIGERMQISYTITPVKGKKASVNVSFTRPVLRENMDELVEIDFKNVRQGWNLLQVVVSSLHDATIQAVSQRKLSVKE